MVIRTEPGVVIVWGVDPGVTGCVASVVCNVSTNEVYSVDFVPMVTYDHVLSDGRRRKRIDTQSTYWILIDLVRTGGVPTHIVVEDVAAMPKQGVSSTFSFGRATGAIEALVSLFGDYERVRSSVWKTSIGVPADKIAAIRWAREWVKRFYPPALEDLEDVSHDGRADALGIAVYKIETSLRRTPSD